MSVSRRSVRRVAAIGAVVGAAAVLGGCSAGAVLGTQKSATSDVPATSHLGREIQTAYPGATNVRYTWSKDNTNFVTFTRADGKYCTAVTNQTYLPGDIPSEYLTVPACREGIN